MTLKPLAAGDPAVKLGQGAFQRFDLADGAAGIGVELVQRAVRVRKRHAVRVGADGAKIAEIQLFGHLALVIQRFGKQHFGVDEQHRGFRRDHRHQMQQHHRFRAKGRHQRHAAKIVVLQRVFQHRRCRMVPVAGVQRGDTFRNRTLMQVTRHPVRLPRRKARP